MNPFIKKSHIVDSKTDAGWIQGFIGSIKIPLIDECASDNRKVLSNNAAAILAAIELLKNNGYEVINPSQPR